MSEKAGPNDEPRADAGAITLFLSGDVMTGRGVDQVLPHPGSPLIHEEYADSALDYVELAERANGPIPRPVSFDYIWGDALEELSRVDPDARIINLETSVTRSEDYLAKGINYRMSPDNIGCITAAGIDCCVLANNHVLDWGVAGLVETLTTLARQAIATAGAGRDLVQAESPAILDIAGKGRVIIFSFGSATSGIPKSWAAGVHKPGVNRLAELSEDAVERIAGTVAATKQPNDVVIASIHWGPNWGYEIPRAQRRFAHWLVEWAGVDVVHGHSSHHPKGIEVYEEKLLLYGCGDFLNDYEGIAGYENFRDDLVLMYLPTIEPASGKLLGLDMTPLQIRNFRLNRVSGEDAEWLHRMLERECRPLGTGVIRDSDNRLRLRWY